MSRLRPGHILLLLVGIHALASDSLWAGTFIPAPPVYETGLVDATLFVRAPGSATYLGTYDIGDNIWEIKTFINDTWGNDMDDWSNPDYYGNGTGGIGIYAGMVITCGFYCAAAGHIPRPTLALTYYFWGRNACSIYHQFFPEIGEAYGPWEEIPRLPRPDACPTGLMGEFTTLGFGNDLKPIPFTGAQPLSRSDELDGDFFLLDEWALVEGRSNGEVKVLTSSSPTIHEALSKSSPVLVGNDTGSRKGLVIQYPSHPHNARHIELPELSLKSSLFEKSPAFIWFRADFAAAGGDPRIEIISVDRGFSRPIEGGLAKNLKLSFHSEKRHRIIAFARVEIDSTGRAQILEKFLYLSGCCCEDWPYCPV